MQRLCYVLLLAVTIIMSACNKDNYIEDESARKPVITFDNADGVYSVKRGNTLTITPTVSNAEGAKYVWTVDSKIVSRTLQLSVSFDEVQTVYATLLVMASNGVAEADVEIDVVEAATPVVSIAIPEGGIKVAKGENYLLEPDFLNDDESFSCRWLMDGKRVGEGRSYTFCKEECGNYTLTVEAANADGVTTKEIAIEVVERLPYAVSFETPSYYQTTTDRSAVVGRPIFLRPLLTNIENATFEWAVDGVTLEGENSRTLKYTPEAAGDRRITVIVSGDGGKIRAQAELTVHCYATEGTLREASASSLMRQNRVYEYLPAPGQFVGDETYSGFDGSELTATAATEYAAKRMEEGLFVSLGGFGGYIIVGFDHSIANNGGNSFAVTGNAFSGASEPGVVWVMQDTNGNGLPDDEWYELSGSETGKSTTLSDYEVTYYRPANGCAVRWTDSQGTAGSVDYLSFHPQPTYYPTWMVAESYTLRGTRLAPNNSYDASTGYWRNNDLAYGYADNYGSDAVKTESGATATVFKISNAIHRDGTAVNLKFIDFVKVQTAVNTKSGIIGEGSTEVLGFPLTWSANER
jgi:hypothetical protein